ncbi:hypothetical protein SUGI_0827730 [Cryptomeria japonica]|uniref:uncharacterized protein LOC131035887 n=1 Tax=Cryptomeria japonica TaxID=3369 RepID=UPI002414CD82|nr:uncharacterized protein LOC131035887 [Cryptomeria japonica]GLJ40285.1 hypothetical protein SUGI_0827730 [Cryptomeria japonica]
MDNTSTSNQTTPNLTGFQADKTEELNDITPVLDQQCTESREEEETDQITHQVPRFNDSCARDPAEALFSLCPAAHELPLRPPPAIEANYVQYYVVDFLKPEHDQYIYRHANGLCVIGLASTHVALGKKPEVKAVDFNVGKSSRSNIKVTGKRKKNAHFLEANSALCKVIANDTFYIIRCCVRGSLLEVNERLIKEPELLNKSASSEGYIAIMMPRAEDWLKSKNSFLSQEEYKRQRGSN